MVATHPALLYLYAKLHKTETEMCMAYSSVKYLSHFQIVLEIAGFSNKMLSLKRSA